MLKQLFKNEGELKAFAARLGPALSRACAYSGIDVALDGVLGAGKTTLVRYIAEQLEAAEPVSSPSYVLQHEYSCPGGLRIEHWDLYRLAGAAEDLLEPGHRQVLRLVEWASRSPDYVEQADLKLTLIFGAGGPSSDERELRAEGRLAETAEVGRLFSNER